MKISQLAREERADLADFLDTLTPGQWSEPTLCVGWRVQDVVAHMISYDELSPIGTLHRLARGRLRLDRANEVGIAEYVGRGPDELLSLLRRHLVPSGLPAAFGGRPALLDALLHHQDIRLPLGAPREIPPDRLRAALSFAVFAPPVGGVSRARGLRLVATDLDWSRGRGQLVTGPADALLMAVAGRPGATDRLAGPGRTVLAERISR
jgi:uncharacterized protein (TIGR03083 family)